MQFAAIQGYIPLKQSLIHWVKNHQIPHAQLFWGPEGNASMSLVLALVTYLHCQHRQEEDSCGQCAPCRKMKKLIHPDVKFVFPTSATQQFTGKDKVSNNFLKTWRSFLDSCPYGQADDWSNYLNSPNNQLSISREETRVVLREVSLKGFENSYKVIIIWLPEYLHITAASALLKVIEEPPPQTLFLLVSNNPERVIGTIRSRMQQIYVPAFADEAVIKTLKQKYSLKQEQLAQIVLLADGNLSKAFKLVERVEESHFTYFKTWMRLCYTHDLTQLTRQAEIFQKLTQVDQRNFLVYTLHLLREALVTHFTQNALTRTTELERIFAQKLRQSSTHQQIKEWINWLNQACYCIERNVNPKMLYLDLSLKIVRAFHLLKQAEGT